jgi:hypothetical protein
MKKLYILLLAASLVSRASFAQDNCASAPAIEPGYYIVDAVNGTALKLLLQQQNGIPILPTLTTT